MALLPICVSVLLVSGSEGDVSVRGKFVYTYALRHWTGDEAIVMTAIALAESLGNPLAYNPKPPDLSYGLWQINMRGDLGPERRKQFDIDSNSRLLNPITNARAAKIVYDQQGKQAWSVYTSGKYRDFMSEASESAGQGPIVENPEDMEEPSGFGILDPIIGPIRDIASFISFITDSKNWLRVAQFVGGGVVIIGATVLFAKESGVAASVVKAIPMGRVAGKAGKIGKAAKVAQAAKALK